MATTQAHPAPSRSSTASASNPISSTSYPGKSTRVRLQQNDDSPRGSPRSQLKGMDDRKRKSDMDEAKVDADRYVSHSPPPSRSNVNPREEGRLTPNSRVSRPASGNGQASPRTQLPSFTNLTSGVAPEEEEMMQGKRRRVEGGGGDGSRPPANESTRAYSSPRQQEYEDEEERQYRREMAARQQSNRRRERNGQPYSPHREEYYETSTMGAPPPLPHPQTAASERRQSLMGEDGYDSNVPLARRRGDAAQAKASRLHIDTGSSEAGAGFDTTSAAAAAAAAASHRKSLSSLSSHGIAKSAPPHKMTFTEREGHSSAFDPRGEPPPQSRGYGNHPYYPAAYAPNHRKENSMQETASFSDASPTHPRRQEQHVPSQYGGPLPPQQQHQQQHPHGPPVSSHSTLRHGTGGGSIGGGMNTPLTAVRNNVFVPQTATLPSPAYHTTHFMRTNPMGTNGPSQQDSRGIAPPNSALPGGGGAVPKTAGLNPPQTARLPEHLRSPPSSKTQFLSLFSNFYDSLIDSRTLKATLEDQVRRSNTLLQTLQKSSRVLELTVDRRMREERNLWESKVKELEERCIRMERQLGTSERGGEEQGDEDVATAASSSSPRPGAATNKSPMEQEVDQKASPRAEPTKGGSSSSSNKKMTTNETSDDVDESMNE